MSLPPSKRRLFHREERFMSRSIPIAAAAALFCYGVGPHADARPPSGGAIQAASGQCGGIRYPARPGRRLSGDAAGEWRGHGEGAGLPRVQHSGLAKGPEPRADFRGVCDDAAAAQTHRETDHFKKYAATIKDMFVKRDVRPFFVGGDEYEGQVIGARPIVKSWQRRRKSVVGVVGLGIMGGAFAQNLNAASWQVIGYDVAADRRRAMKKAGVDIAMATDAAISLPKRRAHHQRACPKASGALGDGQRYCRS